MTPPTKFQVNATVVTHLTLDDPCDLAPTFDILSIKFHFHMTIYKDRTHLTLDDSLPDLELCLPVTAQAASPHQV